MSTTFRKHERLRSKKDFQHIYEHGKKIVASSFVLYCVQTPERPYCRLGITASKKQLGHAVTRNRCKRLVRELFRKNKEVFPPGADVIVVITRNMIGKRYADLELEFRSIQLCM